jgi:hypothetical protein
LAVRMPNQENFMGGMGMTISECTTYGELCLWTIGVKLLSTSDSINVLSKPQCGVAGGIYAEATGSVFAGLTRQGIK